MLFYFYNHILFLIYLYCLCKALSSIVFTVIGALNISGIINKFNNSKYNTGNGWMTADLKWNSHTLPTSGTNFNFWFQRYHFIQSSNAIISKVDESSFPVTPQLNNVLGQAYAYRAWSYLRLVTTFSKGYLVGTPATDPGVPLLLTAGTPYVGAARGTVQEVYTQMEKDIDQSIAYLKNASSADNKSNISINAAYGIKARIALSRGNWSVAAANAALARTGFPLLNETQWDSGFNTYDLPEVIWG